MAEELTFSGNTRGDNFALWAVFPLHRFEMEASVALINSERLFSQNSASYHARCVGGVFYPFPSRTFQCVIEGCF